MVRTILLMITEHMRKGEEETFIFQRDVYIFTNFFINPPI